MQTFDEALAEFIEESQRLLGQESREDHPPPRPAPLDPEAVPVPSALVLTEELCRRYAHAIGDDNPLYTNPAYAERSWLGSQTVPGTILIYVRFPADHGAQRPEGYPVANFLAGVAWEFYDVLRPGMRFSSSKVPRELVVGRVRQSGAISHHSEISYWDNSGALVAKAYGQLVHLPIEQMGGTRVMPVDRLGQRLVYDTEPHQYSEAEIEKLREALDDPRRRGGSILYWEDVNEGDELPPMVQPPYGMRDELAYPALEYGLIAGFDGSRMVRSFRPAFKRCRASLDAARTHPVTRWPYTPDDEHEDRYLAAYRCMPIPFDFGIQRAQMPIRLLTDWAGDHGFVHRMYTSMRRPVFYGDAVVFSGRVIRKYLASKPGNGTGPTEPYPAVAVELEGRNQRDEVHCLGYATVFLPSTATGQLRLPIPHPERPAYVPFDVHRRASWF
jgi:hypothetical protein